MIATLIHTLAVLAALSTPCATEDSNGCYWDAPTAGNGVGHSWYAVELGGVACVTYPAYPADDYCEVAR